MLRNNSQHTLKILVGILSWLIPAQAGAITVTSNDFTNNGAIPTAHACGAQAGANTTPQISWANLPAGTNFVSIIMDDEVSPCGTGVNACVHWNVYDIPVAATPSLPTGVTNTTLNNSYSAVLGNAYDGTTGYAGPCPPSQHTYNVTVFAQTAATGKVQSTFSEPRALFHNLYGNTILGTGTLAGGFPAAAVVPTAPATVSLTVTPVNYRTGDTLRLNRTMTAGNPATNADIYVAILIPGSPLLILQPNGSFNAAITPLQSNVPVPTTAETLFSYTFTGAEPAGSYTWYAALMEPGTLNVIGTMATQSFTFAP